MYAKTCESHARLCEERAVGEPDLNRREVWLCMAADWRKAAVNPPANDPQTPPEL